MDHNDQHQISLVHIEKLCKWNKANKRTKCRKDCLAQAYTSCSDNRIFICSLANTGEQKRIYVITV